ncbi:MAG: helix-turn-helix domain-containing protein [Candidatus Thiodiazotropha sp.]
MSNQTTIVPQITYDIDDIILALKSNRKTVYGLINGGTLRTYKVGRRRYCTHDALLECQASLEEKTNNTA